ncbi:hypothetical protein NDU88_005026 [Pleurodeles waltl]|uniref:Uncharacterized protein n=1 Tax=Pleurodeles waltl TaxID=8319 RepID=A0AAV7L357_PLEWA|nr:hypothetical protein NDU88_005026 [Pleurodeles waltl]
MEMLLPVLAGRCSWKLHVDLLAASRGRGHLERLRAGRHVASIDVGVHASLNSRINTDLGSISAVKKTLYARFTKLLENLNKLYVVPCMEMLLPVWAGRCSWKLHVDLLAASRGRGHLERLRAGRHVVPRMEMLLPVLAGRCSWKLHVDLLTPSRGLGHLERLRAGRHVEWEKEKQEGGNVGEKEEQWRRRKKEEIERETRWRERVVPRMEMLLPVLAGRCSWKLHVDLLAASRGRGHLERLRAGRHVVGKALDDPLKEFPFENMFRD